MQRKVGIREAKAKLSHYVGLARGGEDIVLTEHGKPVVRLVAIPPDKPSHVDVLHDLARLGLVDLAEKPLERRRPIRALGKASISRVVREMRR